MQLAGEMLIGAEAVRGVDSSTGRELDPPFPGGSRADVKRACTLTRGALDAYRGGLESHARFLKDIAGHSLALGALVESACAESGNLLGLTRRVVDGKMGGG